MGLMNNMITLILLVFLGFSLYLAFTDGGQEIVKNIWRFFGVMV